jgi:hypothetical protein
MDGTPQEKAETMQKLLDQIATDPERGWRADPMPSNTTPGLWIGDKNGAGMAVAPDGRVLTTGGNQFVPGTKVGPNGFEPDFDAVDANGKPIWRETQPSGSQ